MIIDMPGVACLPADRQEGHLGALARIPADQELPHSMSVTSISGHQDIRASGTGQAPTSQMTANVLVITRSYATKQSHPPHEIASLRLAMTRIALVDRGLGGPALHHFGLPDDLSRQASESDGGSLELRLGGVRYSTTPRGREPGEARRGG
jgi:hypothetical protein